MIQDILKNQIIYIVSSYPCVVRCILFGSRARGDFTKYSDIDLAIETDGMCQRNWLELTFQLEEILETLLAINVVRFENSTKQLQKNIQNEGIVLYERDKSTTKS